ncbi:MAG: LPP20 family lipoprotein [Desulfuromonas sp.]|nr:LPP20 family lipoprotein [Desulfuromonas sp.]
MKLLIKCLGVIVLLSLLVGVSPSWAGNKRIMSIRAAKVLAERALVESVYGLKLRATESVENMVAASFEGSTESKTKALIKGIKFEDVVYDEPSDIAKVTAIISLPSITNIDGQTVDLHNKVFRRVAFATSTPSQAGPLMAMRAAELDAYKQMIKQVVGFQLESETSVENYMLKSDTVKTKVMATIFMAELVEYGWDDYGDAFVIMQLNLSEVGSMLGEPVQSAEEFVQVEGQGSQADDFKEAQSS